MNEWKARISALVCFSFVINSFLSAGIGSLRYAERAHAQTTTSPTAAACVFPRPLTIGSIGEDVRLLQKILNKDAQTQVSLIGAGSPGNESTYFGPATQVAVRKFQTKYASETLAPAGLTVATGFVGNLTIAKLKVICAGGVATSGSTGSGSIGQTTGSGSATGGVTALPPKTVTKSYDLRPGRSITIPVGTTVSKNAGIIYDNTYTFPNGAKWDKEKQTLTWRTTSGTPQGTYTFQFDGYKGSELYRSVAVVTVSSGSVATTGGTSGGGTIGTPAGGPLTVTCSASPTLAQAGVTDVTWTANPSGGTGSYTYTWSGTDGLQGTGRTVTKLYETPGLKSGVVVVRSGTQSKTVSCGMATMTLTVPDNVAPIADSKSITYYRSTARDTYTTRIMPWILIAGTSFYQPFRTAWHGPETWQTPPPANYWFNHQSVVTNSLLNKGFERLLIWVPFGNREDEQIGDGVLSKILTFSTYERAQQQTPWLAERFVEYWKPLIADQGIEVVAYIGNPDRDQVMNNITDESAWFAAAHAEVAPFVDAGMSIAFDYIVFGEINSRSYRFAKQLEAKGVHVYVENPPAAGIPHWNDFSKIVGEWPTNGCDVNPNPGCLNWLMPMNQIKGEIVVYDISNNASQTAKRVLGLGVTSAPGVPYWESGVNIDDYLPTELNYHTDPFTLSGTDANGNSLTYRIVSQPSKGTLISLPDPINGTARYQYRANASFTSGTDSFTYVANDGYVDSAPATITIRAQTNKPIVDSEDQIDAARLAGGGNNDLIAVWTVEQHINELNMSLPANFVPKRIYTFKIGGQPRSFIAGYDSTTRQAQAIPMGRAFISQSNPSQQRGSTQFAAAYEAVSPSEIEARSFWQSFTAGYNRFWQWLISLF